MEENQFLPIELNQRRRGPLKKTYDSDIDLGEQILYMIRNNQLFRFSTPPPLAIQAEQPPIIGSV